MADDRIAVLIEEAAESGTKAALPTLARQAAARSVEVSSEVLRDNLSRFLLHFADLLDDRTLAGTSAVVDEIELALSVTASGGVELVGKLAAGSEASVRVTLKRRSPEKP